MTVPKLQSTVSRSEAANQNWDAVVIGAGPAGALAARHIASAGARTLLVDKAAFPRDKVCGCCINGVALSVLQSAGLEELPTRLQAQRLDRWRLVTRRRTIECPLHAGVSLSRASLDTALASEAVRAGAHLLQETTATLQEATPKDRLVRLAQRGATDVVSAKMVVGASGLRSDTWRGNPDLMAQADRRSRIGVGAVLDDAGDDYRPGVIYMAYGQDGYVGLVRLEDGRLDIAGALNTAATRDAGGPGPLAHAILQQCGCKLPESAAKAAWRGTPTLTRRPKRIYADRLLLVGDAAGYIEPFTGEGMAWALWSGAIVGDLVLQAIEKWDPAIGEQWSRLHARTIGRRQIVCHNVTRLLRRPLMAETLAVLLAAAPRLANPVIRYINQLPRCHVRDGSTATQPSPQI
jgi:flavin-dependent dehydrogenase